MVQECRRLTCSDNKSSAPWAIARHHRKRWPNGACNSDTSLHATTASSGWSLGAYGTRRGRAVINSQTFATGMNPPQPIVVSNEQFFRNCWQQLQQTKWATKQCTRCCLEWKSEANKNCVFVWSNSCCFATQREGVPGCLKLSSPRLVQDSCWSQRNSRTRISMIFGERVKKITRAHINWFSCMN